jgi:hypothetical protein
MTIATDPSAMRLRNVSIIRMELCHCGHHVALQADGQEDRLDVLNRFINASWLSNESGQRFLNSLLHLRRDENGYVSLREEGWAALEDDGNWVRVCDSFGEERCALVAWHEFESIIRLKCRFLVLTRRFKGSGIPRYNIIDGFRIRLHL